MKNTMLALLVMSSFSTVAADLSQAQEVVSHTDRMSESVNASHTNGYGFAGDSNSAISAAIGAEQAQAHADLNSAEMNAQRQTAINNAVNAADNAQSAIDAGTKGVALAQMNQTRTQQQTDALTASQQMTEYRVKGSPKLTSQVSVDSVSVSPMKDATVSNPGISGTSYRLSITSKQMKTAGYGSINVAVSSLKPSAAISITTNGITKTTTAGEVAKVNPNVQVSVPHVPAFQVNTGKGSKNDKASSHSFGGSGNGANNAANTNSAHGLGGGPHIGGGSAMGGGFHGSW